MEHEVLVKAIFHEPFFEIVAQIQVHQQLRVIHTYFRVKAHTEATTIHQDT